MKSYNDASILFLGASGQVGGTQANLPTPARPLRPHALKKKNRSLPHRFSKTLSAIQPDGLPTQHGSRRRPDRPRHRHRPRYLLRTQHNRRTQLYSQHHYQLRRVLQSARDRSNLTRHTSHAGAQETHPSARKWRWQFHRSQHNWRIRPAIEPIQRCQRRPRPENRCILRS